MTNRRLLFAVAWLASVSATCQAEEKAKCVPKPTLKCVLEIAAPLVDEAGTLAQFHYLADIALAQKKLGDNAALQRTISVARRRAAELSVSSDESLQLFHKLRFAEFFLAVGLPDPILAEFDPEIADAKDYWTHPSIRLVERYVRYLVKVGRRDEAQAATAEQYKWLLAAGPSMLTRKPDERSYAYGQDLLRAMILAGQHETAQKLGAEIWAQLRRQPPAKASDNGGFDGEENIGARLGLARQLIEAGKPTPTAEILSDARTMLGPLPTPSPNLSQSDQRRIKLRALLHELELALSRLSKNAVLAQSTITAMRKLRATLPAKDKAGQLWKDSILLLEAGVKPLPPEFREEATSLLSSARSNDELRAIGEIYAMWGDEVSTRAVVARFKQEEDAEFVAEKVCDICKRFARHGHVSAALNCATLLTGSQEWQRVNRVALYAEIAKALTP
ncbi:MAG: hypothetical protein F9K44_06355 [Hyphomicrobiaceae bacterium]|nr:MAG: hypothetical protein F9K44_06355 [Hyphomicrobiaceae bacterium]